MAKLKNGSEHIEMKIEQTRKSQLAQIEHIIANLEPRLEKANGYQKSQLKLLESVSLGLYDEIDKLSKKAPAEPVTDLVLTQINEVIRETKELVDNDPYVQKLCEFVPAGDNPQHRDAVVVMRQIRQGLERFCAEITPLISQLQLHLETAKGIEVALQLWLQGSMSVTAKDLEDYSVGVPPRWLERYGSEFDFGKLDRTDISAYFEVSNE